MIGYIEGKTLAVDGKMVVVDVNGIGYRIFSTPEVLEALRPKAGEDIALWTHLSVRETALELFGFLRKEDRDFFELLITVPGIGPRSALAILSVSSIELLTSAITSRDTDYLTKISGIGRKTADKIVIELEGKIIESSGGHIGLRDEADALEGLKSLGYPEREVRQTLKKIPQSVVGTSERIREALKLLGK